MLSDLVTNTKVSNPNVSGPNLSNLNGTDLGATSPTSSTIKTDCWLLHLNKEITLAVSIHQVSELLGEATRHAIPLAPSFCNEVIYWRQKILPVIDLGTSGSHSSIKKIMVLKFLDKSEGVNHIGFTVDSIEKTSIQDSSFSQLPDELSLPFSSSIQSACSVNDKMIYILDLDHLYNHHVSSGM
ncbi:MAG: chemotaxis protein CheW [Pseudomonadales bacterium]|nr:chemotaxis protein CheW [Pseudomonadales bacterium]